MIGAGIFVIPAQLAPFGWTGVVAWGIAIPAALLLAYILSRLAAARPEATGAVAIVGEALGPIPGLLVGWSYWVGVISANAMLALTAITYGAQFFPSLTATATATALGSTTLIWALTALNLGGAKAAGRFQVLTTLLKLLPLVAVIAIVAGLALTDRSALAGVGLPPFRMVDLPTAITLCFAPLVGFEAASLAAERVSDPARNIMRATLYGTALTGLLYLFVSNGVIFAVPTEALQTADAPIALFVETFWGQSAGLVIAAFAVIASVGCLNGWVLIQGELPLGMARAGLMPAVFARTSDRDVPTVAILGSSAVASLLILSGTLPGMGDILGFVIRLTTAATAWFYAGACLAALRLGVARGAAGIGLIAACGVLWGAGLEAFLLSFGLMATALPLYWLRPTRPLATA